MAGIVGAGLMAALRLWPAGDPDMVDHAHRDLPPDHPHLGGVAAAGGAPRHAHRFVIDE